jgi:hypothetical protein
MRVHHGLFEPILGSDQLDIERIGWNSGSRVDDLGNVFQLRVSACVMRPCVRYQQIGDGAINQRENHDNSDWSFPAPARFSNGFDRQRNTPEKSRVNRRDRRVYALKRGFALNPSAGPP